MEEKTYYLAIDLGATSGRHIVACEGEEGFILDEVHRFPNRPDRVDGHLTWDVNRLFNEIKIGIKKAFEKYPSIKSLAIDTWGVDYVLMKGDEPVFPAYAYRDQRNDESIKEIEKLIPFEKLYEKTGTQFQYFNTIYQLFTDKTNGRLEGVTSFLMLPEYFSFLLTGKKVKEYTNASTTGLLNPYTKAFDDEIISKLGLPKHLFPEVKMPGTSLGMLKEEIVKEVGGQTEVKLAPSHDTASAFFAVDSEPGTIFISSGTWSLVGAKLLEPCTNAIAKNYNFANEAGVGHIRFLKNITGMWISSELKRLFNEDVYKMMELALQSDFNGYIDVDDKAFAAPKNMKEAIDEYLTERGKPLPKTHGDYYRLCFTSLSDAYVEVFKQIEEATGTKMGKIYIVGGGANNVLINKETALKTGKEVIALPIEATAIGNIKSQLL